MGDTIMPSIIRATTTSGLQVAPDNSGSLQLQTNGTTTALTIDTSQNVGIGTTSPKNNSGYTTLTINNASNGGVLELTNNNTTIGQIYNDASNVYINSASTKNIQLVATGAAYVSTTTNGVECMRIDSSGRVLVGNTANVQSSKAEITSTSLTPALLARVNVASDQSQWAFQIQKTTTTNTTAQIFARFLINDGATPSGYITANGANAATFTSTSDERLKENIEPLPSQLNNILALKPCEFDFKDGSGHQIGFIAQEMEEVYPDCVNKGVDDYLMIGGWSKTEARLVKAIQEQQTIINDLKARIAVLEAK
jgi:hypothetical protein